MSGLVLAESVVCSERLLLYLKGGAYMAVESPTGGPNDIVQNNILYRHYGIAGDGISFLDFLAQPM